MPLGASPGHWSGKTARKPAKGLVPQPGIDQHQRRHGDVPLEEATTRLDLAACLGLFARLPVSCITAANAAASDRHRTVQICLLQAERIHQAGAQCAVLEAGTSLSRRY